jgi:hypothetical protein
MRSLGTVVLSGLVLSASALLGSDGAGALLLRQDKILSEPAAQFVARKGTRNYVPGEDALTAPSGTGTDAAGGEKRDPLAECMAIWDAGTHITKSKWREICERQIKERGEYPGSAYGPGSDQ